MLPKVFVTHLPIQDVFDSQNEIEFSFYKGPLPCPKDILEKEAKNAVALVTSLEDQIDKDFLSKNPHLKVIANNAVGFKILILKQQRKRI